jgi:carbon-monoxide dehydrogenase large subunit
MAFIGQPLARKEDDRLLSGKGCFSDDVNLPGQLYAAFVRSPHAHARLRAFDASAARTVAGFVSLLTGEDAIADGLKPIPVRAVTKNPHEVPLETRFVPPYPALPADKARYVGEAVAMVVAETLAAAKDAADLVGVDYEPLPAVVHAADACAPGAPLVWEEFGSNLCLDCQVGDVAAAEAAFGRAAHIVRIDTAINRVTGVPMEARVVLGAWEAGRYTVHATSGGVQKHRSDIAAVLGVEESAVRVITRDLGGNYGTRNNLYPEYALVPWAARRLGRPVKWRAERSESFLSDEHTRDLLSQAELALDAQGGFLALRWTNTSNGGAHAVSFIPLAKGIAVSTSLYRIPAASIRGRAVLTNTSPTTPYRAAGRPEVMYITERLIDLAARRHGFDRVELRRRNLVSSFPYRNALGLVYDSGDYLGVQARALELADWNGFARRKHEAARRGKLRGIGMGNYVELNTGAPRERAEITVLPGRVELAIGTLSSGQGHETSFAQLVADWLDVDPAEVSLRTGDTDIAPIGGGTHSGRSLRMGAAVIRVACRRIIEQGREAAGALLEAAAADIEFAQGRFTVKGTDRSVALFEVARQRRLCADYDETTPLPSYPFGCAVCEVEVDPDTGVVQVVRHSTVDDCGRAVNPLILHGQTHGGIVAGLGQALMERCHYDRDSGQLLCASFMDYAMPRADQFPFFDTEISEVPSTTHPLGMRGGGEGGTTPALAALANAICDALDIEHIELPATPERVWRALRARAGR